MSQIIRQFQVIREQEDPGCLRVAFASDDGVEVNQHFGSTRALIIYWVNPDSSGIERVVQFAEISQQEADQKLAPKLKAVEGCVAVYCRACGASAVRQLINLNVQPLKAVYDSSIKDLLQSFQNELQAGPSSWLARAIERQNLDLRHHFE